MQRDVPVREVMDREFVAATASDDLCETVELLLREESSPAVVLEGADVVGVLGDRDVMATLVADVDPETATVGDAMTESVPTTAPTATLDEARDRMATRSTPWLVVVEGGEPVGVLTERDVLTGSAIGSEVDATEEAAAGEAEFVEAGATAAGAGAGGTVESESFEDQGICEKCGSLRRDLTSFNGQLLCAECRDI